MRIEKSKTDGFESAVFVRRFQRDVKKTLYGTDRWLRFADQIRLPRRPVIFLPSLADTRKVLFRNVDVDNLDPSAIFRRPERKRQHRVHRGKRPILRPPRLNDQRLRLYVQDSPGKHPIKSPNTPPLCGSRITGRPVNAACDSASRYMSNNLSGVAGSEAARMMVRGMVGTPCVNCYPRLE